MSEDTTIKPKYDSRITLGNLLTIAGGIVLAIGMYYQLVNQTSANASDIKSLRDHLTNIEDSVRQTRSKTWDRVNDVQLTVNEQNQRITRIEEGQKYIIRLLDKVVDALEKQKNNN